MELFPDVHIAIATSVDNDFVISRGVSVAIGNTHGTLSCKVVCCLIDVTNTSQVKEICVAVLKLYTHMTPCVVACSSPEDRDCVCYMLAMFALKMSLDDVCDMMDIAYNLPMPEKHRVTLIGFSQHLQAPPLF